MLPRGSIRTKGPALGCPGPSFTGRFQLQVELSDEKALAVDWNVAALDHGGLLIRTPMTPLAMRALTLSAVVVVQRSPAVLD